MLIELDCKLHLESDLQCNLIQRIHLGCIRINWLAWISTRILCILRCHLSQFVAEMNYPTFSKIKWRKDGCAVKASRLMTSTQSIQIRTDASNTADNLLCEGHRAAPQVKTGDRLDRPGLRGMSEHPCLWIVFTGAGSSSPECHERIRALKVSGWWKLTFI